MLREPLDLQRAGRQTEDGVERIPVLAAELAAGHLDDRPVRDDVDALEVTVLDEASTAGGEGRGARELGRDGDRMLAAAAILPRARQALEPAPFLRREALPPGELQQVRHGVAVSGGRNPDDRR
jgi:hypothetical protein